MSSVAERCISIAASHFIYPHLSGITFLFAALTEVLVGAIQGFRLDERLQGLLLQRHSKYIKSIEIKD